MVDKLSIEVKAEKSNWSNKIFELEEKVHLLSCENNTLYEKLKVVFQTGHKGKGNGSDL